MKRSTNSTKRVAVIGAGPAGLATIKELRQKGIEVVGFERQPTLGGVYASQYDQLLLTSSNMITSFSDHAQTWERGQHMWTRVEYLEYLMGYAERFDLCRHIHFSTTVQGVRRDARTGRWHVRAEPRPLPPHLAERPQPEVLSRQPAGRRALAAGGEEFEFDHVAICTGSQQSETQPDWPGLDSFRGEVVHSARYWRPEPFAGRRVLVVGLGESGADITLQIAKVAQATAVSTRNGPGYVIPRYYNDAPTDVDTTRCYHALPLRVMESRLFSFNSRLIDFSMGPNDDPAVLQRASELNAERGLNPFRRFGTKSTRFVEAMLYHETAYRPDIERIEADRVVFVDGSTFECDTILLCTGYRTGFPFLAEHHPELAEAISLVRGMYKRMVLPSLGPSLAWIGFVRPGLGSIPPCAEIQARYFALLVNGERTLPSPEEMARDIEKHARLDFEHFVVDADRMPTLTDYLRFLESVADAIGCRPPLRRLLRTDPQTWAKVMFGPITGAQYRLAGPGADPQGAREALRKVPIMLPASQAFKFTLLLGTKLLHTVSRKPQYETPGF